MNATTSATKLPRRDLNKVVKGLQSVIDGLTNIINRAAQFSLSARTTKPEQPKIKRAKRAIKARAIKVAHTNGHHLPKHLKRVVKKLTKKSNRLTDEQKADIKQLVTKTEVPVAQIAQLFHRQPQTIYNLIKAWKLDVHKGSPELIAGVKRAQKEGRMTGPGKRQTSVVIPTVEAAQA